MACPAAAQAITHGLQQLRQQEEVILKERIRRHFPTLGRDAQDYLDSAFGRRMRADELDLLIERGFGDLAFLQIHYQPVVGTEETDVQALFELVPLAANHDAVAIAVGLRTGNHWRNKTGVKLANPLEQINNLLVFELELDGISQMLILATATLAEVRAERFDPVGGGSSTTAGTSPRCNKSFWIATLLLASAMNRSTSLLFIVILLQDSGCLLYWITPRGFW